MLAVLMAVAGLTLGATGRDRNEAVYPQQHIPLNFSHQQHIEEGADCVACHDPARKSVKAADVLTPRAVLEDGKWTHPECDSCHDIEAASQGKKVDPPATCDVCHIGWDKAQPNAVAKTSFPTPNLVFNHKVHIDRKIECSTCHFSSATGSMEDVKLGTRFQLPKMDTCLSCHNGSTAPAECRTCHISDPSGRMQLAFANATLRPMQGDPLGLDHGPRYEFTHAARAKVDRRTCNECHTDSFCTQCHDSMQKPLSVHPNDFVTLHAAQARMDMLNCQACHRYQSFCAACHERVGIGLNSDPSLRARNLSVHGDYNTWAYLPGPGHHSVAAARDIQSCMSCHREETCTTCHIGGSPYNPHPANFKTLCGQLVAANNRGCLKCHAANSNELKCQ
jgi:hypothetical protein